MEKQIKKPATKKNIITKILIVILITVITFTIFFNFVDLNETWQVMQKADSYNLGLAICCLLLYFITFPLSLCIIAKTAGINKHFCDSYLIGCTEHFFNGITPFATGGQPIQMYLYTKAKLTASEGTGIVLTNFIAHLIAANLTAFASLIFYAKFAVNFNASTSWMIGFGFAMNFLTLGLIILMATSTWLRNLFKTILMKLIKIKFLRFLEKLVPIFDDFCQNAQICAKAALKNKTGLFLAIISKTIALIFFYAIPFFILRSLDVNLAWNTLPFIVLASAFAITTMVWVPTPGGTGGIEFAFLTIFTSFAGVTSSIGSAGTIIWRGLTYYLLMAISFGAYLLYNLITKKRVTKEYKKEV